MAAVFSKNALTVVAAAYRLAHEPRCPECAAPVIVGEGCRLCRRCAWSACQAG